MGFLKKKEKVSNTGTQARTVMRCANCGKHVIIVELTTKNGQAICSPTCMAGYNETEKLMKTGRGLRQKAQLRKFFKKHWKYFIPIFLLFPLYIYFVFISD